MTWCEIERLPNYRPIFVNTADDADMEENTPEPAQQMASDISSEDDDLLEVDGQDAVLDGDACEFHALVM
jgi:hypothetical protein